MCKNSTSLSWIFHVGNIINLESQKNSDATTDTVDENKITNLDPESDFTNPKIMETWVDNILKDAEVMGMEHKFMKK